MPNHFNGIFFSAKGAIYYVAIAVFHVWSDHFFTRKLTWYFIGVDMIKSFSLSKCYLRFFISSRPLSLDKSDLFGKTILLCILNFRVIRELEAQLEYEREKREKLEAQMDKLRAQIHTLTLQLEDERSGRLTAVRFFTKELLME